LTRTGFLRR